MKKFVKVMAWIGSEVLVFGAIALSTITWLYIAYECVDGWYVDESRWWLVTGTIEAIRYAIMSKRALKKFSEK